MNSARLCRGVVGVLVASLLLLSGGVLAPASAAPVGVPPAGTGGTAVGWGDNDSGQTDVPDPPAGQHYTAIAAGYLSSLALTDQGTVVAWGNNTYGQTNVPTPPAGQHYTAIASGYFSSMALTDQGTVVTWGTNGFETDVPAPPTGQHYTAIAAGYRNSLALTDQGTVVAWGDNTYGENDVPAPPTGQHYTAIAASYHHDLALTDQGTVVAWGWNDYGQTNVPAPPTGQHYTAIAAGYLHSVALTDQGNIVKFGVNGTPPSGPGYTAIAAGYSHSLAIVPVPAPAVSGVSSGSGPVAGGDQTTITGTGFTDATAVTFDGTPAASFTVDSPTQITATTPARKAGAVNVRVTTYGGRSPIVTADHYTYSPVPTVTTLSRPDGRLSGGETVVITGTGFTGATGVRFGPSPATSWRTTSSQRIVAVAPASPSGTETNAPVTVTTPGGTNDSSPATTYRYRAVPTVTGVTPATGATAGGETITVTGTDFTRATKVTFGGLDAIFFTVDSPTQLTATTPAHTADIVNVRITTAGGGSPIALADRYRYR